MKKDHIVLQRLDGELTERFLMEGNDNRSFYYLSNAITKATLFTEAEAKALVNRLKGSRYIELNDKALQGIEDWKNEGHSQHWHSQHWHNLVEVFASMEIEDGEPFDKTIQVSS